MSGGYERTYGRTTELFASANSNADTIIIGGQGEDQTRWTRTLTRRAARLLWYQLGSLLFPQIFSKLSPGLGTIPIRSVLLPTVTSDLRVDAVSSDAYELAGRGASSWSAVLSTESAHRLWTLLDDLLKE